MNKIITLLLVILFLSCNDKKSFLAETKKFSPSTIETSKVEEKSYDTKIEYIKKFAMQNSKNEDIAFMIDYSLHSGKNRFFVVDIKKNKIIKKALVCHGSCKSI